MVTKRWDILQETCSWKLQICLSMCDIFVNTGIKGLRRETRESHIIWTVCYYSKRRWGLKNEIVESLEKTKMQVQLSAIDSKLKSGDFCSFKMNYSSPPVLLMLSLVEETSGKPYFPSVFHGWKLYPNPRKVLESRVCRVVYFTAQKQIAQKG